MKGQSNMEYIVALIVFVTITIYISFQLAAIFPQYHAKSFSNKITGECYRLSDTMIKDSRTPYGFAKEQYELNSTKLSQFNSTCNGNPTNFESIYRKIKGNMTLPVERDFLLDVWVNGSFNFQCGRTLIPAQSQVAEIQRYAESDNQIAKITLKVW